MAVPAIRFAIWLACILAFGCPSSGFVPADNHLIDCGSLHNTAVGKRVFAADSSGSTFVSTQKDIFVTAANPTDSPLHKTARVLLGTSTFTFPITKPGRHWIRLHFYPFVSGGYDLQTATFNVSAQGYVLLGKFRPKTAIFKEYSLNVASPKLAIRFSAAQTSFAFLNAIEVVSVPDDLFSKDETNYYNLSSQAIETSHRVNMGGFAVSPDEDTLSRTWVSDATYLLDPDLAAFAMNTSAVRYVAGDVTPETAPRIVYGSLTRLNTAKYPNKKFNVTWDFQVDSGFQYLIRIHLCDIVNKKDDLVFNIYIGTPTSQWTHLANIVLETLGGAYLTGPGDAMLIKKGPIRIKMGPNLDWPNSRPDAIMNGLEILKLNNSIGSLSKNKFM